MATLPPSEPTTPGWGARLMVSGQWLSRPHPALTEVGVRRQAQLLMAFAAAVTVTGLEGLGATLWQAATRPAIWRLVLVGTPEPSMTLFAILPLALVLGRGLFSLPDLIVFAWSLVITAVLLPLFAPAYSMAAAGRNSGLWWALGLAVVIVAAFRSQLEQTRLQELQVVNRELAAVQATLAPCVVERTRNAEMAREETEAAHRTLAAQMWLMTGQAAAPTGHRTTSPGREVASLQR